MSEKTKNVHKGHRDRVRNRFLQKGIGAFDDHEILEFLLFYVHRVKDTNTIGHELIDRFKTLDGVFSASYEELCKVNGIDKAGASLITFVGQLRNRISLSSTKQKLRLSTNKDAGEYCMGFFEHLSNERVILVSLNSLRDVLAVDIISEGGPNSAHVDVRKIVETAMMRKASGVIIAHNHPGDSTHPSSADVAVTDRVIRVLEGIDIAVIDHIICNETSYTSMSERGILETM